jgi:hypothetical protein
MDQITCDSASSVSATRKSHTGIPFDTFLGRHEQHPSIAGAREVAADPAEAAPLLFAKNSGRVGGR